MHLKISLRIENAYPLPVQKRDPTTEKVSIHSRLGGGRHAPLLVSDLKLTYLAEQGFVWEQLPQRQEPLLSCGSAPFAPRHFCVGKLGFGYVVLNANRASFMESSGVESLLAFEIASHDKEKPAIEFGAEGNLLMHIFRDVKDKVLRRDTNREYVECALTPLPLSGYFSIHHFDKEN